MCNRTSFQKTNWIDSKVYVGLSKSYPFRLTNHRKIPCSKYRGRYIMDAICFSKDLPNDEEVEPP